MYTIVELQTTGDSTSHLVKKAATKEDAMSKYHTVLAAAATSKVDYHACVVLNEEGVQIARESYIHMDEQNVED